MTSNIQVKARPAAAGTSRKRAAPYLKRCGGQRDGIEQLKRWQIHR